MERSVEVAADSVKATHSRSENVLTSVILALGSSVPSTSARLWGNAYATTKIEKRVTLYKHNVFKFRSKQSVKSTVYTDMQKTIYFVLYTHLYSITQCMAKQKRVLSRKNPSCAEQIKNTVVCFSALTVKLKSL